MTDKNLIVTFIVFLQLVGCAFDAWMRERTFCVWTKHLFIIHFKYFVSVMGMWVFGEGAVLWGGGSTSTSHRTHKN